MCPISWIMYIYIMHLHNKSQNILGRSFTSWYISVVDILGLGNYTNAHTNPEPLTRLARDLPLHRDDFRSLSRFAFPLPVTFCCIHQPQLQVTDPQPFPPSRLPAVLNKLPSYLVNLFQNQHHLYTRIILEYQFDQNKSQGESHGPMVLISSGPVNKSCKIAKNDHC